MHCMATSDKLKQLIAHVPEELSEQFKEQCKERGNLQYRAETAAIRLWVELPADMQARLINQPESASSFVDLVQAIVDRRILDGNRAAAELRRRQKRGPRG
jgi:hypothetical protein